MNSYNDKAFRNFNIETNIFEEMNFIIIIREISMKLINLHIECTCVEEDISL